jgi:hypothetical protein
VGERAADAVAFVVLATGGAAARASSRWAGARWAIWTGTILAVTLPWGDMQAHPDWHRVATSIVLTRHALIDLVANVLLYVPFGCWYPRREADAAGVGLQAAVLSAFVETTQLMSRTRVPSVIDVAANCCGALVGSWFRLLRNEGDSG